MKEEVNERNNRRRRERYASDSDYRRSIILDRRNRYRTQKAKHVRDCSKLTEADLKLNSRVRTLADGHTMNTVSTSQLAELIGYHHITVIRWQTQGVFPKPRLKLRGRGSAFTVTEAKKLAAVMAEHQKTHQYLFESDKKTVSLLKKAMS